MKRVIIEPPAFLSMVVSTVETFKLENYGLALGYKLNYGFVIEHAIPIVSAKRSTFYVASNKRREQRVREMINNFQMGLEVIGDFHSHTGLKNSPASATPSSDDLGTMERGKLYVILAANESPFNKRAFSSWKYIPGGFGVRGTSWGLNIELRAFELWGEDEYRELKVICPLAAGI
ncbi:MAG TPA: Mov34/MPN/PAD-1 family protein [Candidatus Hydrothermia bacterium]|nr:Mov34/MPN/PAD-1 family protein [Candidatus Hydrothermia bacterium]MDD5572583.1 Mov34/MPN/PAD-1 family protein [Candidatus Hydrothermia bacterium]HOP31807.1 Mov34/MPN/PAD-1 family protein [Candidatus Hydrothermia bacterium]